MATKPKLGIPARLGGLTAIDDDPSQYVGADYFQSAPPEVPGSPSTSRTWGAATKDVGASMLQGGAGLVKFAGDLYGLAAGDMQNPVSELGASAQDYWQDAKSPVLKARMAERDANIAAQTGVVGKAWTAFKDTVTDPALAADTVAGNVATLIPGMAAGRAVAAGVMSRALAAGPITKAASIVAGKTAAKYGTAAAIATGGVQQGADVSSNVYDMAMKKPDAVWDANPEFVARVQALGGNTPKSRNTVKDEMATMAARMTFPAAFGISIAANAIPGARMLERALVGGMARQTIKEGVKYGTLKATGKAVFGETTQEGTEEGGGQFAGNLAIRRLIDPNHSLGEQVGENTGMGMAGGLLLGVAGGAAHDKAPHVAENGALSRAANVGIDTAPPPPAPRPAISLTPEQTQALLDHANTRRAELDLKAKGRKGAKITGPDGKPLQEPDVQPEYLTPAERGEREFLDAAGGDAQALARAYRLREAQQAEAPPQQGAPPASAADLPQPSQEAFEQRERDRQPEPTGAVLDGDILNPRGEPFKNMAAAMSAQKKAGEDHEIVRVAKGLVVRRKAGAASDDDSAKTPAVAPGAGTALSSEPGGSDGNRTVEPGVVGGNDGATPVAPVGRSPAPESVDDGSSGAGAVATDAPTPSGNVTTLDDAANVAATSPQNDIAEPTDAQKKAGNYQKGHVTVGGLDLSIENPAGSTRSGIDRDGKAWENTLQHHYGYIKGTVGNDKDHVDAFIKPGTSMAHDAPVFVVDQVHPDTGKFDEHKVLIGFGSMEEAKAAYRANYAKGWQGMGAISTMPWGLFKPWVQNGPKNKPLVPITRKDKPATTAQPAAPDSPKLPADIAGAKPRYNYGPKAFTVNFESDVDRAAYIAAQATPSKRDADYVKFAMDAAGMSDAQVREHGARVRDALKARAKDSEPGELAIPEVSREPQAKPATSEAGEKTPETKPASARVATQAEAAPVSSREGQMNLAYRASRIAAIKGINAQLRKIAPDEAWADANIESAKDLDALMDQISEATVKAQRGPEAVNPLRAELDQLSGAELREIFKRMNLAGERMTAAERVDALMAESESEVRAAMATAESTPAATTAGEPAPATEKKAVTPSPTELRKRISVLKSLLECMA